MVENGSKRPLSSTVLLYLQREQGARGLQSMEEEYILYFFPNFRTYLNFSKYKVLGDFLISFL